MLPYVGHIRWDLVIFYKLYRLLKELENEIKLSVNVTEKWFSLLELF